MDSVIRVENLGKRYRLGRADARYGVLRESIARLVSSPVRALRRKKRVTPGETDEIWALKDVSFEVRPGEVLGVVGRNGAGKSTLLKILSRITEPTTGAVTIWGRVGSLLEVGTGFHPELTGRENILLNGAILGMQRAEILRRFDDIVEFAELSRFLDTPVKRYSSGMYVRLAFAVAAHLDPEVLLIDEVLAVGDAAFQRKCLERMETIGRTGRTILFVSHNMTAVTTLCTRAILLREGSVETDGPPDVVVGEYLKEAKSYQQFVDGRVLLSGHPGRLKGQAGVVALEYARLMNQRAQSTQVVRAGEEVTLALGFSAAQEMDWRRLAFVVSIADVARQRVFSCSTEFFDTPISGNGVRGEARCTIQKLPLTPGTYAANLGCKVAGVWSDGVYDAFEFEVVGGPFFESGRVPPDGYGRTLVDHSWVIVNQME